MTNTKPKPLLPALVEAAELAEQFGVTTKTIKQWAADNTFPRPCVIQPRKTYWLVDDIQRFIDAERGG